MKHKTWLADHSQSALIYRIIELLFQLHWFLKDKDCLKKNLSIFYRTIKLVAVGNMVYMMYLNYKHLTEHLRKYYSQN